MRPLRDIRLGRWPLLLLTVISAAATVLIIAGGHGRTPAQTAALAALRERPAATTTAAPATTAAARPRTRSTSGHTAPPVSASGSSSPSTQTVPAQTTSSPAAATSSATTQTTSTTATTSTTTGTTTTSDSKLPKVGHVFELVVTAKAGASAFGARSALPYLNTLARRGTLLSGYRSLGAGALADELALVSGQAPNADTVHSCPRYVDFPTKAAPNAAGILHGRGCVYPDAVLTIGDQVTAAGKTWHAYVDDMGKENCVHPNSDAVDDTALPFSDPGYDTRHNPFIYFHSLLDLGDCATDDVDLGHLPAALSSAPKTPEFDYVAPGACADAEPTLVATTSGTTTTGTTTTTATTTGAATTPAATTSTTPTNATPPGSTTSTTPAGCPSGTPSGATAENTFLRIWVRRILASAAYRANGMLVIAVTRDGHVSGSAARTGALVLSRWTPRGHSVATKVDPYSLLRLQEDALRLKHLAHAAGAPSVAGQVLSAHS